MNGAAFRQILDVDDPTFTIALEEAFPDDGPWIITIRTGRRFLITCDSPAGEWQFREMAASED